MGTADDRLTDQQRKAVLTRTVSVALSAGAGCGKTHVLTERFLSHLDPLDADQRPAELGELVAITFTDRAAREMRDRIRRKCRERLLTATDDLAADHWLRLLRELDTARVSTIHALCTSILRSCAVQAGVDPNFTVLDATQAAALSDAAVDDALRRWLVDAQPCVIRLATHYGLASLRSRIQSLVASRDSDGFADVLDRSAEEIVDLWRRRAEEAATGIVLARVANSPAAAELLTVLREHRPSNSEMARRRDTLLELLPSLRELPDLASALGAIRGAARVQGAGGRGAWPEPDAYERFRDAASNLRKVIDDVTKAVVLNDDASIAAAEIGLDLLRLASEVSAQYEHRKRAAGLLDFDDLLVRTRRLLTDPDNAALRRRLARQTRLVLVDELQDTDAIQAELIEALCDGDTLGGKLFFVGDHKQSIYRFRGAQPDVFRALHEKTPAAGRLPLSRNFRSQPAVLDFVNALFCRRLESYEPLRPHRTQAGPLPAVEFLWCDPPEGPQPRESVDAMRRREADWIARRLRELFDGQEPIVVDAEDRPRPARYADVAILFRALSDVAFYEEALRQFDIPYYLVGGKAFYAQQEVFDLLNLLRSVTSDVDEVSLLGALRSAFFSIEDETLFWLASGSQELGRALLAEPVPSQITGRQRGAVRRASSILRELRDAKDRLSIAELIGLALRRTGYDATLLAEFLGERKLANLHKLVEQARGFDQNPALSLADYVETLENSIAVQPDEALAATCAEESNVVRLMSIHQSKGLEFPVVVVADIDRAVVSQTPAALFDRTWGPLVSLPQDHPAARGTTGRDLYTATAQAEDEEESIRLFYVAQTRAADYLVLSAAMADRTRPKSPWTRLLADVFDLDTGGLKADLPSDLSVPEVRVTSLRPEPAHEVQTRTRRPRWDRLIELIDAVEEEDAAPNAARIVEAGPVAPSPEEAPTYSFSRLTGALQRVRDDEAFDEAFDETAAVSPREHDEHRNGTDSPAHTPDAESRRDDALLLGTLVHDALAEVDFRNPPADPNALVRRAAMRNDAEESLVIPEAVELVRSFLASDRARQLAEAEELYPEIEFLLAWPAAGAAAGRSEQQTTGDVRLQGFIDLLYRDRSAAWHILDYKTNRVGAAKVPVTAALYEMQMLLYCAAVEEVFGRAPESLTLHFLRPGTEFRIPHDDDARERLAAWLHKAIAADRAAASS